mmetsp:Transcript_30454/g.100382  ORF Transcript_30454/g.100382 Transcript_30454/m.100382 type:complete len:205 (+) Transcript_30454:352-966(+)
MWAPRARRRTARRAASAGRSRARWCTRRSSGSMRTRPHLLRTIRNRNNTTFARSEPRLHASTDVAWGGRTSFCPALGGGAGHANVPPRRLRLLESRHVHRGTVPHVDERHRVVAALAILRPLGHARHPIHRRVDRRLQHRAKHARRADRNVPHARVRERRLHQLLLPRLGAAIPVVLGLLRGVVAPVLLRLDGGLRLRRHRGHG